MPNCLNHEAMNYRDKHVSAPNCVEPDCPTPAEKLILIGDKPYWACLTHYEILQHVDKE